MGMTPTLSEISGLFKPDGSYKADESTYGVVTNTILDENDKVIGYEVGLSASDTNTITCRKFAGANVGDTVMITRLPNGSMVVIGKLDGDADAEEAYNLADDANTTATTITGEVRQSTTKFFGVRNWLGETKEFIESITSLGHKDSWIQTIVDGVKILTGDNLIINVLRTMTSSVGEQVKELWQLTLHADADSEPDEPAQATVTSFTRYAGSAGLMSFERTEYSTDNVNWELTPPDFYIQQGDTSDMEFIELEHLYIRRVQVEMDYTQNPPEEKITIIDHPSETNMMKGIYTFLAGIGNGTTTINGGCITVAGTEKNQVSITDEDVQIISDDAAVIVRSDSLQLTKNGVKIFKVQGKKTGTRYTTYTFPLNVKEHSSGNITIPNVPSGASVTVTNVKVRRAQLLTSKYVNLTAVEARAKGIETTVTPSNGQAIVSVNNGWAGLDFEYHYVTEISVIVTDSDDIFNICDSFIVRADGSASAATYVARNMSGGTGSAVHISGDGTFVNAGSSRKIKHDIAPIKDINYKKLYDLEVVQFKYNADWLRKEDEKQDVLLPGFIAEDVDALLPEAVIHNDVPMWDSLSIIPMMLKLIQDQKKEIDSLREEVKELREMMHNE